MARETQLDDTEAESFSQYEQDHTARMRALMESISSSTVPEQITNQAGNYSMNDSPNLRFNPAQNSVQSLPNSSTSPQSPETIPNLQNPSATKMHEKPSDNSDMGPSNLNYQNGSAYDTRLSQESNLDTNGVDRLQSVTNTSSNSNSKRSSHTAIDASKEIATKMLQGWTLLAEHCPRQVFDAVLNPPKLHSIIAFPTLLLLCFRICKLLCFQAKESMKEMLSSLAESFFMKFALGNLSRRSCNPRIFMVFR